MYITSIVYFYSENLSFPVIVAVKSLLLKHFLLLE